MSIKTLFIGLIDNKQVKIELNKNINGKGKIIKYDDHNIISIYNGSVKNGEMDDSKATLYDYCSKEYTKYIGSFKHNQFNGYGELFLLNNKYQGYFYNGLKHGYGKILDYNNKLLIENIWINNIIDGSVNYKDYYSNGQIKSSGILKSNKKIDVWIYYYQYSSTISRLEYYSNNSDTEVMESYLDINEKGYIIKQLYLNLNNETIDNYILTNNINNIMNKQIINYEYKDLINLKNWAIPVNLNKVTENNYFIELSLTGKIDKILFYNNQINVKYICLHNNLHQIAIYKLNSNKCYLYTITNNKSYLYYIGTIDENYLPDGYGIQYDIYKNDNNIQFEGEFIKGNYFNGKKYFENHFYEGEFQNNIMCGEGKIYDNSNKLLYEGNFLDGLKHNFGISYHDNGNKEYEGMWEKGLKHGEGKMYESSGKLIYVGYHELNNLINVL